MVSFENTKIAFANRSDKELRKAHFVFSVLAVSWLNNIGTKLTTLALNLKLPVKGLIKYTVFDHFCGGEDIEDCKTRIKELDQYKVGTILDYSVEGEQDEQAFDTCLNELLSGITLSKTESAIPFCVVKLTGLIPFSLLEKVSGNEELSDQETDAFQRGKNRIYAIAKAAFEAKTPLMIDAEESWIQDAIDDITFDLMIEFNSQAVIVYNTAQMYRHDRLAYVKGLYQQAEEKNIHIGLKVVRGAYMEKERERAEEKGYPSPIQPDKASTDRDYDLAIQFCVDHLERIGLVAGTHNEASSMRLVELMQQKNIEAGNKKIYFSQLLGMSDHISFNLSKEQYNVAKYMPYGPVKDVMPYLIRRANENTSVAGQTGRELSLIRKELTRRRK